MSVRVFDSHGRDAVPLKNLLQPPWQAAIYCFSDEKSDDIFVIPRSERSPYLGCLRPYPLSHAATAVVLVGAAQAGSYRCRFVGPPLRHHVIVARATQRGGCGCPIDHICCRVAFPPAAPAVAGISLVRIPLLRQPCSSSSLILPPLSYCNGPTQCVCARPVEC